MDNHTTSKDPRVNHTIGISIASVGILALSFDAVVIRLAEVSAWDAAFWRGCFIALALIVYLLISKRLPEFPKLRKYGWAAIIVCCIYGFNTAIFVFSITYTTVANTVVILCSTPFFAALFSWLMLHERMDRMTWATITVAVIGVFIVFLGTGSLTNFFGNVFALILALSTGFLLTYLRHYPGLPRISAIALGALLSGLILLPLSTPLNPGAISITWLVLSGCLLKPLASVCMLTATRYIPSPEVSIFLLLESLLAPILAWFIIGEAIDDMTLIGGATVLLMVAIHSWWEISKENKAVDGSARH